MHNRKYVFAQPYNRESLRDIVQGPQAHAVKTNDLGFGKHAVKRTLEDINTKCDYRIFEKLAYKSSLKLKHAESLSSLS